MSTDRSQRGNLIVISGPSGVGKTSICKGLLERLPGARWSISATTRDPRRGEVKGESYTFLSREEFKRRMAAGEFLETAEYLGNLYGTPEAAVRDAIEQGHYILLEIEVQGGAQVAAKIPDSVRIFILPPTMDTLRARLEGRQTESERIQEQRLMEADGEIGFARDNGCYTNFVTNDDLENTIGEILQIIAARSPEATQEA